jgi:hypothetical protein
VRSLVDRGLGREQTVGLGVVVAFDLLLHSCLPAVAGGFISALFELAQKVLEAIGNALVDHVIIDSLKDVPEPTLIFAAQAPSSLSCMGVCMHCRLWP